MTANINVIRMHRKPRSGGYQSYIYGSFFKKKLINKLTDQKKKVFDIIVYSL